MKIQTTTPAPRLMLKKERLVCLTTLYTTSKAGGRTLTSLFTIIQ
ncbi:MAG TPA: hypothetical protein VGA96_02930 [Fibrella sp.]